MLGWIPRRRALICPVRADGDGGRDRDKTRGFDIATLRGSVEIDSHQSG